MCIHTHIHTYTHTQIHTYRHTYIHTYIYTHSLSKYWATMPFRNIMLPPISKKWIEGNFSMFEMQLSSDSGQSAKTFCQFWRTQQVTCWTTQRYDSQARRKGWTLNLVINTRGTQMHPAKSGPDHAAVNRFPQGLILLCQQQDLHANSTYKIQFPLFPCR